MAWAVRIAASATLTVLAFLWGERNFDGRTYCEIHHISECDGLGVETLAPFVLWPVTAIATVLIVLLGSFTAPKGQQQRAIWAALLAVPIFTAHRNNLIWAAVITGLATWGVLRITDDR